MLVITGLMRSGTSALAALCHEMGFVMGRTMTMPLMGTKQIDFDDTTLGEALVVRLDAGEWDDQFFKDYWFERELHTLKMKEQHARGVVCGAGVKSPFLLPYLDEWREVDHEAVIVLTDRDVTDTYASIEKWAHVFAEPARFVANCSEIQERLEQAWKRESTRCDLVVPIETLRNEPEQVRAAIERVTKE